MQEEEWCNITFPMCICRLTLAWISCENSTTHEECWLILTGLPSLRTLSHPIGLSAVQCRLATRVTLRQLPSLNFYLSNSLSRSFTHFRSRRDRGLWTLFGFAPKQTKGPSAWQTTNIVLHNLDGPDGFQKY